MTLTQFKVTIFFCFSALMATSQVVIDTVVISGDNVQQGQDAFIGSAGLREVNFGSFNTLNVFHDEQARTVPNIFRSYLSFNLTHVPKNAIITNATLYLTPRSVSTGQLFAYQLERVDTSWNVDSVKWVNQAGSYSSDALLIKDPYSKSTSVHEIDVKSHIQNMINYPYNNHGWKIRLTNENLNDLDYGINFHSSNSDLISNRPKLIISYVLPIEISSQVTHCTIGNADGELDLTISNGSGNYNFYDLSKVDGDSVQVINSSTTFSSILNFSNLEPGLYMIKLRDALYNGSDMTDNALWKIKFFLVGREGEEISCILQETRYIEDVQIGLNLGGTVSRNDCANINYEDVSTKLGVSSTGTNSYGSSNAYHFSSLLNFNIDIENDLEITLADLHMKHWAGYFQKTATSNATNVTIITSEWDEDIVTWNSRPDTDTTQIIFLDPSSNPNGFSYEDDTINLIPFMEYWQTNPNYGIEMELTNLNYPTYNNRDHNTLNNGSYLEIKFKVKPVLTASYDEVKEEGSILVNAPNGDLPYTYLISYQPIPDLQTIWNSVKDSLGIDSVLFFQGKINHKTFEFNHLGSEEYYISIFDNDGVEIFQNSTFVGIPWSINNMSSNVIVNDSGFTLLPNSVTNGLIKLNGVIPKNENGKIEFLVNKKSDMILGFRAIDSNVITNVEDYFFGLEIALNGDLLLYYKGELLSSPKINTNDKVELIKEGSNFILKINDQVVFTKYVVNKLHLDLSTEFLIRATTNFAQIEITKYIFKIIYPISHDKFDEVNCDSGKGFFRWHLLSNSFYFPNVDPTSISINGQEIGGGTSFAGAGEFGVVAVDLGIYNVTISWQNYSGVNFTETFYFEVGSKMYWNNIVDMGIISSTFNSITPTTYGGGVIGQAVGSNILPLGENGWFSFNVKSHTDNFSGFIPYGKLVLKDQNNIELAGVTLKGMGFGILNKWVVVNDNQSNISGTLMNGEGPVKVEIIANTVSVFDKNANTLLANLPINYTNDLKVYATARNSIIYDSYTSFCEGLSNDKICGHLDYELNSNYYYTNSSKFCFVYNEEYNDSQIEFNIYNINNYVIATEIDLYTNPLILGENRVVLDFSQYECMIKGFYVLEVINNKEEKFYLRFYYDGPSTSQPYESCYIINNSNN